MILKKGNMWDEWSDVKIFTGNATIKNNGALVMGRGAAKEAKSIFPNCDVAFGSLITHYTRNFAGPYGILIHPDRSNPILCVYQVKWNYYDSAELDLIRFSTGMLDALLHMDWRYKKVSMNFPGIGWGGLERDLVMPIIRNLPDNLTIWEYR